MDIAQLLSMGRPEYYIGSQPASMVMQQAQMAQQAANQQADINSRNYGYDRDFWKGINQMMSDQKIQEMRSANDQSLAGINNAAALQRAQMETDAQRYGYDSQLQSALAQVLGQQNIAGMNNESNRYATDVNAQAAIQRANLEGQYGLQNTLIPQQYRQQRFDTIMPLLGGVLGQYLGGGQQQAPQGMPNQMQPISGGMPQAASLNPLPPFTGVPGTPAMDAYIDQTTNRQTGQLYSAPASQLSDQFIYGAPQQTAVNPTSYGPPMAYGNGGNLAGGTQSGVSSLQSSAPGSPQNAYSQATQNQISTGPLVSDRQQSQMLNSALAGNAQAAAQATRNAQTSFGARGWSPSSPALRSYQNRIGMNQMLADTQARTQIPLQAAKTNADYSLQAQQGNLAAQNQRLGALSGFYNSQSNMLSPILSALVSMGS